MVLMYAFLLFKFFVREVFFMAKLKGPLMSMDARGQLGKSLVFLGWKGLKTVRSHVIPANPNTDLQKAQRAILKAAVALWHTLAYNVLDLDAFRVLASVQTMVMSGFNAFCKLFIKYTLLEYTILAPYAMAISANTGGSFSVSVSLAGVAVMAVKYGSSPSVLGNGVQMDHVGEGEPYTKTLSGFAAGDYVYFQMYTGVADVFVLSGIYKVLVLE